MGDIHSILRGINQYAFPDATPEDINGGKCYYWAAIAKHLMPEVELFSVEGHAFVKLCNVYYDAECLRGVGDWKQLPSNASVAKYKLLDDAMTTQEFYRYWRVDKNYLNVLIDLSTQ